MVSTEWSRMQEGSNEQDNFEVFSNVTARQLFHASGAF